jgi:uncharacterized protein YebE (UPF0316 family)
MIDLLNQIITSDLFNLVGIPFLIFFAKVIDVGLSTLGLIFTSRGYKKLSALTGIIEISIYLLAISAIIEHITEAWYFIAYASGYAVGTYVGMWIEEKLSIGFMNIRVISKKSPERIIKAFRTSGYKATIYKANSTSHRVYVITTVVRRKDVPGVMDLIRKYDRSAFYSVEDIRDVSTYKLKQGMQDIQ